MNQAEQVARMDKRPSSFTLSAVGKALMLADRNDAPYVLFDWWNSGRLDVEALRLHITHVWQMAEWPCSAVPKDQWIKAFRATGYLSDNTEQPRPSEPWTVYRGAPWGWRRGMSWTTDVGQAAWFAARWTLYTGRSAYVFEAVVRPEAILALVGSPEHRNEDEVVVDPPASRAGASLDELTSTILQLGTDPDRAIARLAGLTEG